MMMQLTDVAKIRLLIIGRYLNCLKYFITRENTLTQMNSPMGYGFCYSPYQIAEVITGISVALRATITHQSKREWIGRCK